MILIFSEDGGLIIADDLADVQRHCEGVDVASSVFAFFDENGDALKPVFDAPVRRRKLLWFAWTVDSGHYHLERDPAFSEDPLWVALHETRYLEPNERFASVQEVKTFLRARGAPVDRPADGHRAAG
jgi:hypothetical protein